MRVFFDSSAFVKRYVREEGTDVVLSWCDQATELCLSGIALPEIVSAFCRLLREDLVSPVQYRHLKTMLMADISDAAICDLTPEVIRHSIIRLEKNVLRGMDAIHLGSALALKVDLFVSADARQCDAATQAGLRVVQV
ncbi:type II toxin-antitoxin system VapC family toxin [Candidatus Deferrimicrobium sp.]|uniref:type II toxin-antitoxin system VapC family toxin n=1 Tax=Candidatus Deferrimicrobium sp. TaxID=3060586 RepID=UPI00272209D2|nr:type II toxin-antitoxin system VapC family toxin [Candidatus Deferrimicrobium sp.]MDO8737387.1 type II toxin-antitoxin system VapC family toxin [Candidatus Deferrimicrobium sp.]